MLCSIDDFVVSVKKNFVRDRLNPLKIKRSR